MATFPARSKTESLGFATNAIEEQIDRHEDSHSVAEEVSQRRSCGDALEAANQCPICLSALCAEAYVDPCFHKFCFHCILQWAEIVATHPSLEGTNVLECPLCRVRCRYLIQIERDVFKVYNPDGSPSTLHFVLSEPHFVRLTVYRQNLHDIVRKSLCYTEKGKLRKNATLKVLNDSFLRQWVRRELQALLHIDDVEIIVHHVLGVLERFEEKEKMRLKVQRSWKVALADAIRIFLAEHSEKFCEELECFLASGMQLSAYDKVIGEVVSNNVCQEHM